MIWDCVNFLSRMSRGAPQSLLLLAFFAFGVAHSEIGVHSAETSSTKAEKDEPSATVDFRRVFINEEQIPKASRGHFPVTQDVFDNLLKTVRRQANKSKNLSTRITSAEYTAQFEKDSLVGGTAVLAIAHTGEHTGVVRFDDCNLSIRNPSWQLPPGTPAFLGTNPAGYMVALVEKPGTLAFDWSLQGSADEPEVLQFDVRLPLAPLNRLKLALPRGMTLSSSTGVVTKLKIVNPPANGPIPKKKADGKDGLSDEIWQIDMGGQSQAKLRIAPEKVAPSSANKTRLRQTDAYDISAAELKLRCDLRLDIEQQPLRKIVLEVSPELRIIQINAGEKTLSWEAQAVPTGSQPRIVVALTEPLLGHDRLIRVQAVAPPGKDKASFLPTIRPTQLAWSEGSALVTVREALVAQDIEVNQGRQTQFNASTAGGGESFQFQYYSRQSNVKLRLERKASPLKVSSGTTVTADASTLAAHLLADLHGDFGARFEIDADIAADWVVDDVITIPGEHLDDYEVTPAAGNARQRVHIRLRNAISPQRTVRLSIRAHRRRPTENLQLTVDQLRLAEFRDVRVTKRLLSLNAESNWKAELTGDFGVERVDSQKLTAAEAALLTVHSDSVILRDDEAAHALKVRYRASRPEFAARLSVQALVTPQSFIEDYRFEITPDRTTLGKLVVQFSESREEPLVWMLDGPVNPTITARRMSAAEAKKLGILEGEVWELTLRSPRGSSFEIRANRTTVIREGEEFAQTVSLVSLPQATSQLGTVVVAAAGVSINVQSESMSHIPTSATPADEINSRVEACRYDPGQNGRVTIKRAAEEQRALWPAVWAWSADFISHDGQPDRHVCEAIYRLENAGAAHILFALPEHLTMDRILVDGVDTPILSKGFQLQVALPANVRFPTVLLRYASPARPSTIVSRVSLSIPLAKFPVLQKWWTVWMPGESMAESSLWSATTKTDLQDWKTRLFGPLWKRPLENTYDTFRLFSDFNMENRIGSSAPSRQILTEWTRAIETASSHLKMDESGPTLIQVLKAYNALRSESMSVNNDNQISSSPSSAATSEPQPMLIDAASLAEIGIYADTELNIRPTPPHESAIKFAVKMLKQHGLVIIQDDSRLVLSNVYHWALHGANVEAFEQRTILNWKQGLTKAARPFRLQNALDADAWERYASQPRSPWRVQESTIERDLAYSTWSAYRVPVNAGDDASLVIFRTIAIRMFGTAALITALAVVVYLSRVGAGRAVLGVLLFAIVATLACPVPYLQIFRGLWWGAALGAMVAMVRRRHEVRFNEAVGTQSTVTRLVITGAAPCLLIAGAGWALCEFLTTFAHAAEPATTAKVETPQILIPVDDNNKPTGKYIYVSNDFYHYLLRRQASSKNASPHGWLLTSAAYSATASVDPATERLEVSEINATFDFEVFEPGPISLPLSRETVNLLTDRAMLNGQPINVDWEGDGRGIAFDANEAGNARLEIALRPVPRRMDALSGFDMTIPRVSASKLRLRLPTGNEQVTIPSAGGGVSMNQSTSTITAELGPTNLLSVRWSNNGTALDASKNATVEQMLWMRARPGSVVVDAKLLATPPLAKSLQSLTIRLDPRLSLLSLKEDPQIARYETRDGDPREVRITFKDGVDRPVTLNLSFLLVGAPGVGQLVFPYVEAENSLTTRSWGAVTVAPTLQMEFVAAAPGEALNTAEFLEAWGKADYVPQVSYRLTSHSADIEFPLRYTRGKTTGRATMDVVVGRKKAEIRISADLKTSEGTIFQHQLSTPKNFVPAEVSVVADDTERVVRWSITEDNLLRIMLNGPLSGEHSIFVRGEVPATAQLELRVPRLMIDDFSVREVSVYRDEEIQSTFTPTAGWDAIKDGGLGQYFDGLGRLVARLHPKTPTADQPLGVMRISNAKTSVAGKMFTVIQHTDKWQATIECRLQVDRAGMEVLRFEIPGEWSGPFEVEPAAEYSISKIPGQSRQHLLVRFRQSLAGVSQVRIRGPISATAAREHVPEVVPLDLPKVEQFVAVPTDVKGQKIEWETSFLQAIPLPDELAADESLANFTAYRVAGRRFRAAIRQVEQRVGEPYVTLAEYSLLARRGDEITGMATFDVEPVGQRFCKLDFPHGCLPIHIYVEGCSPTITRTGDKTWTVPLGPEQLSQRIEIIYSGIMGSSGTGPNSEISVPTLVDLPVRNTIWSVRDLQSFTTDNPASYLPEQLENDRIRLRELLNIARLREDLVAAHNVEEIQQWFYPWRQRLQLARRQLEQTMELAKQQDVRNALAPEAWKEAEQLLTSSAAFQSPNEHNDDTSIALPTTSLAPATKIRGIGRMTETTQSIAPLLVVPTATTPHGDVWLRVFHVTIAISLAYLFTRSFVYDPLRRWLTRKPYLLLLILGSAWWLYLTPVWVAWVIIAWGLGGVIGVQRSRTKAASANMLHALSKK